MKELGGEAENEHHNIINLIKELQFNNVILVGSEFKKVAEGSSYKTFADVEELIENINKNGISGKKILIKGSNSIHLNKLINIL